MRSKKSSSAIEAAATLPGEYEFISAIAGDLANNAPRSVYADWLEERGDPRTSYVRTLVEAVESLDGDTRLPDSKSYPQAWLNMLGVPLFEGIKYKLFDVKDSVLRLARPIVAITTQPIQEKKLAVGASKFGGHPDLPAGVEWPRCEEGPLGFLGQIALEDLKQIQVAHSLPKEGLLSFFAFQFFDSAFEATGSPCVLHSSGAEKLYRSTAPNDLTENWGSNGIVSACSLAMCESWDLPEINDNLPAKLAKQREKVRKSEHAVDMCWIRDKCKSRGHHLLGYSWHQRARDPSGPDWPNLLCLDSDDNLDWNWCDGEHLAIFVHKNDLKKGTFKRTFAYAS